MLFRVYVNAAKGNDHVRVIDVQADSGTAARLKADKALKKGEKIGDVVQLNDPNPEH